MPTPLGNATFQGALARKLTPGRNIVSVGFTFHTGIELQRFMRDFRGRFIKGMPSGVHAAHDDVGWTVSRHMYEVLRERMRAKQPKRPGREQGELRRLLRGDLLPRKAWRVLPGGRGVELTPGDLDRQVPYWRSVNDGWQNRVTQGHLFRTRGGKLVRPIQAAGRVFSRLGLSGDPRMPRVGADIEFVTSFEGYRFYEEGMKRARRELNQMGAQIYLRNLDFPEEMQRALTFFAGGGRIRDEWGHVNDPRMERGIR